MLKILTFMQDGTAEHVAGKPTGAAIFKHLSLKGM